MRLQSMPFHTRKLSKNFYLKNQFANTDHDVANQTYVTNIGRAYMI
jgi:hypothetical protein